MRPSGTPMDAPWTLTSFESTGFNYEVGHFCDLLRSSRTESPTATL